MSRTQNFGENENQNHADEEPRLLSCTADTSIADNSDRETGSHAGQTDSETSTKLDKAREERVATLIETIGNQDGDDETVDTDDTSHNDGHNVYRRESVMCCCEYEELSPRTHS